LGCVYPEPTLIHFDLGTELQNLRGQMEMIIPQRGFGNNVEYLGRIPEALP